jgi:hypothetical protein
MPENNTVQTTHTSSSPADFRQHNRQILKMIFAFIGVLSILCALFFFCIVAFNSWQNSYFQNKADQYMEEEIDRRNGN